MSLNKVPTVTIRFLAEKHIKRYSKNLEHVKMFPSAPVNAQKTTQYLDIWLSIHAKDCDWDLLTSAERNEVLDAAGDES